MMKDNFEKVPCILINYNNSNILVNVNNKITKKDVIDSAITGNYLEPKSTCHMVVDSYGVKHPIIVLSPNFFCNFSISSWQPKYPMFKISPKSKT